ncbi:glycosyltransferase [Nitratireductor sp. GCM10026969]|uniref:glycosyltransferase n=1 Tax=Nitratireductor sp. GCM10026969 TaxID=3252645 RepID=UPI003622E5EE
MKVLHVYKAYLPDDFTGVARVIHTLAEGLAPHGVESHVLSLSREKREGPLRVGSHYAHHARQDLQIASTGLSLSVFTRFRALAGMADVVHYHFPWPVADALYFLHGRGKPALVTYHSDIVRQRYLKRLYLPLMRRFLDRADAIVATSPDYAETSPVLRHHRARLSIIPIGAADRVPPATADLDRWHRRVGDSFFLFIGALRYYKGLPFLIEAAERTGLPVVVAGSGNLEGWAAANAPANVTLVGAVSETDKEALLSLCRAFVFPSHLRSEAFGVALLEAARAGKPMISCKMGSGTSYVNADGQTGITVAPADAQELASAMAWLAENPDEATQMGRNAHTRFEQLFRAEDMCRAYLRLYERLAARNTE